MNDSFLTSPDLWGLFLSAFVSATLLPGGSELVLAYLSMEQQHPPLLLWGIATAGNSLGGMSSWLLGRLASRRLLAPKPSQQRAIGYLIKWGRPMLLLSWLPVIGDGLCLAAGWLRIHPLTALLWIGLGKGLRYGVVMALV
ncbi:MAG: hypothetical protein A2V90_04480 [Gammaproteobacteria bacterium RBG_16_57_12]|nr:MAG: hypothetical protein A2V90_04480 [Gammaproteobacteria bacterium RBG_16_57_12]